MAELQGRGLASTTRTCDPRLRRAVLSSTELQRVGIDGRGRTCTSGFVDRCLDPFGHVDMLWCAPPTGCAPVTSGLTGRCFHWLSYGGLWVRALGLEPSLVRGKGPVPYQSGVTRIGGPGGNRTPSVGRRLVYSQLRPMARPTHCGARWNRPRRRCLCSSQSAGRRTGCPARARPEGIEPPARGFGGRGATMARAQEGMSAHDVVRVWREGRCNSDGERRLTSARRACRYWQIPDVPAATRDRAIGRAGTHRREGSTKLSLGASSQR